MGSFFAETNSNQNLENCAFAGTCEWIFRAPMKISRALSAGDANEVANTQAPKDPITQVNDKTLKNRIIELVEL